MSEELAMNPDYAHQLKWYYWPRCPLLPDWRIRPADKYNEWNMHFHWLIFIFWTLGSPDISFDIELNDQNFQLFFRLPFLKFGISVPLFPMSWHQKLWRYPRQKYIREDL